MTGISKTKTNPAPPVLHHLFQFHENTLIKKFNLSLRNFREPLTHDKKTSNYVLETVIKYYFFELNCRLNVSEFKTKVKSQKGGEIFPCRLCKDYLSDMDTYDMMKVWSSPYSYKNLAQINNKNNDFAPFCTLYL